MPSAAGGASAPSSSFASLERTLDQTIECLVRTPHTREARALLIEARRLRNIIGKWGSIPPTPDVRDDMLQRVVQLSSGVAAAFPEALPEIAAATQGPLSSGSGEEETEGYALDFEPQLYSLEAATNPNRLAVPLPAAGQVQAPAPAPIPLALPPSDDEPTRVVYNTSFQAPADFEPSAPEPVPWPVDDPVDPISPVGPAVVGDPQRVIKTPSDRASFIPPLAAQAEAPRVAVAQPAAVPVVAEPPAPRGAALSSPDVDPRASAPRILTYEFDPEGDDLSVPRTQIAAHAVKLSDPVDPLFVVLTDAYSTRADAYRTLRRKLATLPTTRVLGVTSAEPGEGKTVFAVNLALTLRESTRSRVLIVEANLRTPRLAKILGFETPECFIQQLKRHADDPRAPWVVAEPLPKLHVMAIDPLAHHDPLLDPVTFSAAMDRIKQAGYEYVIVDSPPVLGNLDCNVISDAVDAMLLTAIPMKSHRSQMRKAVAQLEPAPILGVVVLES